MLENEVSQLVGHLFRTEAGRMAATLTRLLGFEHYEQAEDIVQETLLKALSVWKIKGVPENPSAWLYTVAKRKAIDVIREKKIHHGIHTEIARALKSEWTLGPTINQLFLENEIEDSQLRMMFACSHPAIPYESQLALILKTLCGLSVSEIARGFLTNEETITKRLYRAREKIREENINLEAPPSALQPRLDSVLHAIYLLFNEGYNSSHTDILIRDELCEEAMRLCLLLIRHKATDVPKSKALLALMCFQASRSEARLREDGSIVLMKDQDRSLWNKALIEKGEYYLELSAEGDTITEYHLEAMIAACHAEATSFRETDWRLIVQLYEALLAFKPGPVVEMNKAIAVGYHESPQAGIAALKRITSMNSNHLYHAALGDFYVLTGDKKSAYHSYTESLRFTNSKADQKLLQEKMTTCK